MKTLTTQTVGEVGSTSLERTTVELPTGRTKTVAVVRRPNAIGVLPLLPNPDGRVDVLLAAQPRPAIADTALVEVVAGKLDPGETNPEAAAARELGEEVGLAAEQWRLLAASLPVSPGYSTEHMTLFACWDLHTVPGRAEDAHITSIQIPLDDAIARIDRGEITDLKTITALLLTQRQLSEPTRCNACGQLNPDGPTDSAGRPWCRACTDEAEVSGTPA